MTPADSMTPWLATSRKSGPGIRRARHAANAATIAPKVAVRGSRTPDHVYVWRRATSPYAESSHYGPEHEKRKDELQDRAYERTAPQDLSDEAEVLRCNHRFPLSPTRFPSARAAGELSGLSAPLG